MWGGAAVAGMSHVTTLQEAGAVGLLPAGRKEVLSWSRKNFCGSYSYHLWR